MRWFGGALVVFGLAGILLGFVVIGIFTEWKRGRMAALEQGSEVLATGMGEVEIADSGEGNPVVVVLHGGGGGYDQGLVLADCLRKAGMRILSISRPGYLRTPLESGPLLEQQADLLAATLMELQISNAGILGFGEGAAVAVAACLRHPHRFSRMALLSPIVLRNQERPEAGEFLLPGEAVLEHLTGDMGSWWMMLGLRFSPTRTIQGFLEAATNIPPFEVWKLAPKLADNPGQMAWFQDYLQSLTPLSPRETGTRNDLVQVRTIPGWNLAKLDLPVLVLRGANDKISPLRDVEALTERVPGAESVLVSEAGFLLPGFGAGAPMAEEKLVEFFRGIE